MKRYYLYKFYPFLFLLITPIILISCTIIETKNDQFLNELTRQNVLGRYYDFDDIQVPVNLKLNKNKSVLFRIGSLKAGVLAFSEKIEAEKLVNFFLDSMNRDNWHLKSSSKYPKILLFFAKPNKTAIIQIIERIFTTEIEIWVAPSN